MSDLTLKRLEYAMAPNRLPSIDPPQEHRCGKDPKKSYWRSGFVTALTREACVRAAQESVESLANIPHSLKRIPWC